jgi:phage anti-repressor protein
LYNITKVSGKRTAPVFWAEELTKQWAVQYLRREFKLLLILNGGNLEISYVKVKIESNKNNESGNNIGRYFIKREKIKKAVDNVCI